MSVDLVVSATPEQELLVETSARFIASTLPLSQVRALAEAGRAPDAGYYETAASLGWFGMLADERHGGGSASGNGVLDAAAVAAERGAGLQPGPFVGTNVAVAALAGAQPRHAELVGRLVRGQARATWVAGAVAGLTPDTGRVVASADGDGYVLRGSVRHVADADECDHLLVTADGVDGPVQLVVDANAPGVGRRRLEGMDITRRGFAVSFDDVRVGADALVGEPGAGAREAVERELAIAAVLTVAESVGAMHHDFTTAVEHARTRIAFGRPIGSFQAVKHLLADTSLSLEMAKGLVVAAAEALGEGAANAIELAHAAKSFVAERGIELTHACFQVLGGIGYTWEHDHHLFMRRLGADAVAFGSAQWHRARLGEGIGVG
ncbi:MAG: acyl-CoA dehydrogenase [Frankia sp.]|nr:acyl-CoA dehydrogenase [Frankia sp.]